MIYFQEIKKNFNQISRNLAKFIRFSGNYMRFGLTLSNLEKLDLNLCNSGNFKIILM